MTTPIKAIFTSGDSTGLAEFTATDTVPVVNGGTGASDAPTARTNLGLGDAATYATGTSGSTVPLLSGANTWGAVQYFPLGSAAAPSLSFTGDTNTGIFSPAADTIGFAVNGSEKLRVISGGSLIIGWSGSAQIGDVNAVLQTHSTTGSGASFSRYSDNTTPPIIALGKSRSGSVGGVAIVQNNDPLGKLQFAGADGTDLQTVGAEIKAEVDGTPGSNDMPSRLVFSTTADGAASPTERMRIGSAGNILIGTTTDDTVSKLQVNGTISASTVKNAGLSTSSNAKNIFDGYNTALDVALNVGWISAAFGKEDGDRTVIGQGFSGKAILGAHNSALNNWASLIIQPEASGRVLIGTTTDDTVSKLQVNGSIRANTGILFGTDTAAANTLDDYEEGTWTPAITFGGNSVGLTYAARTGKYTKIGNLVSVDVYINLSNKGSSTGDVNISGFPFSPVALGVNHYGTSVPIAARNNITLSKTDLSVFIDYYTGSVYWNVFAATNDGSAGVFVTDTAFANTSEISFSCSYRVS